MSRLRLLNPFRIRAAVREIRRVQGAGGPKLLRRLGVAVVSALEPEHFSFEVGVPGLGR